MVIRLVDCGGGEVSGGDNYGNSHNGQVMVVLVE